MHSNSHSYGGSKSEGCIPACSDMSGSNQEQSPMNRSERSVDVRTILELSFEDQGPSRSRPSRAAVSFLEPRRTQDECDEITTSTFSVLKAIRKSRKRASKLISKSVEKNRSSSSSSTSQTSSRPRSSLKDLSKEEAVLKIIDKISSPSFNSLHDFNSSVDMSDLELQMDVPVLRHLNNYGLIRKSEGQADFTHVKDFPVDDIHNVGYPYLQESTGTTLLDSIECESASTDNLKVEKIESFPAIYGDSWTELVDFSLNRNSRAALNKVDPNLRPIEGIPESESTEALVRVISGPHVSTSDTITCKEWQSLLKTTCEESESLDVLKEAVSETNNGSHPNSLFGNDEAQAPSSTTSHSGEDNNSNNASNDNQQQVNFMLSTSEYDLVYAPDHRESPEENPIVPEIESPRNSASNLMEPQNQEVAEIKLLRPVNTNFDQDGSNHEINVIPGTRPLFQIYLAKQTNLTASEAGMGGFEGQEALSNSNIEPTNASSSSNAERDSQPESLQHTGSARLVESLPGLNSQRGQFDKPRALPTAQEQLEVEDEMLRLATRSKRFAPPMELGLYEWQSIVQVLSMNEPDAVKRVLCRLSKMTTKRFCDLVKFYKCGLFDKLLALLEDQPDEPLIQNLSMKLIAELSVLPDCRVQLLLCQRLLLQCITYLKEDTSSPHFQECASKILSAVAKDKTLQLSLLNEHDLIEILLQRMIKTSDPDIRCNCMEITLRIIQNEEACKSFIRSEQFNLNIFHMLLDSKYAKIQQLALGLLVLITRYETEEPFQEKLYESGLALIMITILQSEAMVDFSHLVVEILCNIANTDYGLNFLRNSGVIKFLVDFIHTAGKEDLLGCGLDIIVKLSVSSLGRAYLVEFNIPARLVKYLKLKEETTLERACVAIANLSENLVAVNEMVIEKPAEDLIRLIYEDNPPRIKFAASRAMYEMAARDEQMCRLIAELHLTEVFHHTIWSGFAHVQTLSSISDTIQTISHYPRLKSYMINEESIACFLDIIQGYARKREVSSERLEGEEALRVSALQCLRCYMSEPECRKLFLEASGVYVIRSTLQSPSIVIRQATALFIDLAARDPTLSRAMVVAGMIPIMLNDSSMNAACPAWRKALNQIFNNHLPSKFAYCNRLDITDITSEGFYVAATRRGEIQVLDNLLNDKKCPIENIYVCNFAREHQQPDRSVPSISRPRWLPWQMNAVTYPQALAALGNRCVATIWQRKVSLLYGDSSEECCSTSLKSARNESRSGSVSFAKEEARNSVSSINRRVKDWMANQPGVLLTSVNTFHYLPKVYEGKTDDLSASLEKYGVCPLDLELNRYYDSLMSVLFETSTYDEMDPEASGYSFVTDMGVVSMAETLAVFVARQMSGNTDNMPNMANFLNVSVWDLKECFQTSILPLGHLKAGLHLERALLFKIIADRIGLPCSLVRGEYGIAYNELCVPCDNNDFPIPPETAKPNFVIDLMNKVGKLYFISSPAAFKYCNIPN